MEPAAGVEPADPRISTGSCGSPHLHWIRTTPIRACRAKLAILVLHQYLGLGAGLAVAFRKIDRHPHGFPVGWIRTRVAIVGANFPCAVALGDEILGTGDREFPAGDEQGGDAEKKAGRAKWFIRKENRPRPISSWQYRQCC